MLKKEITALVTGQDEVNVSNTGFKRCVSSVTTMYGFIQYTYHIVCRCVHV